MIYLVTACTEYEGSDIIGAFKNITDAKALIAKCQALDAERPECPGVDAPNTDWIAHAELTRVHDAAHPSPWRRDYYFIAEIELQ